MPKLSFQYVSGPHGQESLVDFLARRFRYHSGAEWRELIAGGHVTVNGERVRPGHRLRTQHRIVYDRPPFLEPEVDRRFRVIYEDEHLLAVEKSGNIPTSPSGKYWKHCLVHVVRDELGLERLHACHRLDRETSGLNLLAKSPETAGALGDDFREGRVEKAYAAVLRGALPVREAYLAVPLARDPDSQIRIKQAARGDGKPARTRFRLLARLPGSTLMQVETLTGRTHQIRAHAAFLGYPVWGDKLYGRPEADFIDWVSRPDRPYGERHLLHATRLAFRHPVTGEAHTLRSSPAPLIAALLDGAAAAG